MTERFDAGVRGGEPFYFKTRPEPKRLQDLLGHNCINLRLPTHDSLYAWEFERGSRELKVRIVGQLAFKATAQLLKAALAGLGLAYGCSLISPRAGSCGSLPIGALPTRATTSSIRAARPPRRVAGARAKRLEAGRLQSCVRQ